MAKKKEKEVVEKESYIVGFFFLGLLACLYAFAIGHGWISFNFF